MSAKGAPSVAQKKGIDEATLVDQLNDMLTSLNLPISLISPTDLTPSLLIAILESILGMRISLVDRSKDSKHSKSSNLQNMKIFLGVLETDILKADVGLSDLDPRRLADGEQEEVFYVAELLCWIGRRMGMTRKDEVQAEELVLPRPQEILSQASGSSLPPVRPLSPKSQLDLDAESLFQGGSTVTGSTRRSQRTSSFLKTSGESDTSLYTGDHQNQSEDEGVYSDDVSDVLSALPPFIKSNAAPPQCIHEIPSPSNSLLFSVDRGTPSRPQSDRSRRRPSSPIERTKALCECDTSIPSTLPVEHDHSGDHSRTSVRYSGFIQPVDEDFELASFESSRSVSFISNSSMGKTKPSVKIESVKKQYMRTLELLNERTRLLTQLSELKNSHG
ncbi:hypothetical protein BDZ97DRAFT_1916740 [Flammula alnicola]|nr:hypothetical protein BDZ97DRAFT_1916740 [Flammula alnicola]